MIDNSDRRSRRRVGCGGGCGGCGCLVLTVGLLLALLSAALGVSLTARVPGTHSNITIDGSIGKKALTKAALPGYVQRTFGGNTNLVNYSASLTIWIAEGRQQIVLGRQPGAPFAGVSIDWKSK